MQHRFPPAPGAESPRDLRQRGRQCNPADAVLPRISHRISTELVDILQQRRGTRHHGLAFKSEGGRVERQTAVAVFLQEWNHLVAQQADGFLHGSILLRQFRRKPCQWQQHLAFKRQSFFRREHQIHTVVGGTFAQHRFGRTQQSELIFDIQCCRRDSIFQQHKLRMMAGISFMAGHVQCRAYKRQRQRIDLQRALVVALVTVPGGFHVARPFQCQVLVGRQRPVGKGAGAAFLQSTLEHGDTFDGRHYQFVLQRSDPERQRALPRQQGFNGVQQGLMRLCALQRWQRDVV